MEYVPKLLESGSRKENIMGANIYFDRAPKQITIDDNCGNCPLVFKPNRFIIKCYITDTDIENNVTVDRICPLTRHAILITRSNKIMKDVSS